MHALALAALPLIQVPDAADLGSVFELPAGLVVELWAETPLLHNPTAIDVDARGRVWVTEAVQYRRWRGRNPGPPRPNGDRVVVLEDADGDGVCDASTVFVEDPDLVAPLGIALVGPKVYVSCSPSLFAYSDTDGDGVADARETVLTGFGGHDHDHGLHSVVPHTDGKLYAAVGNAGPHLVTGPDGFELRSGSIYDGGGATVADNRPGLVSSDGRVWTGGLVLRFDHDGANLEVLAHNFRNPYEVALDRQGELFTADNDDDGNQACRTTWVMPGGNYGFFSADGARTWQADRRPGHSTQEAHWHQHDPGVAPPGTINGAGGPTGVAVYEGELMERWIGGAVLDCDAGARVVRAHRPVRRGSGLDLEPGFLIRAKQDSSGQSGEWFRPSDVCVGPSGEVYVADWYDPGVGGHAAGDRRAYGRILRIRPADAPLPRPPVLDLETAAGRRAALASPAVSVRELARRALAGAAESALEPAGSAAGAVRALPAGEAHAAVARRKEAYSLRLAPFEGDARERMLELAAAYDGQDPWLLETIGIMLAGREEEAFAELAAELGAAPLGWDARFEGLAWRLHPVAAVPGFLTRAMSPTLAAERRRRAIDALAFTPVGPASRAAADALVAVATAGPEDLRPYALWWLTHRDSNDWRGYGVLAGTGASDRRDAARLYASGVMHRGLASIDVDVDAGERLWLVVGDGGDGNGYDWAAWGAPRFVMADGNEVPARGWLSATAEWGTVGLDRDPAGGTLEIGEVQFPEGFGTHARSEIELAVPRGALRFRAEAGPERGGTDQAAGRGTSLELEVWVRRAPAAPPVLAWREALLDEAAPEDERLAAALALAADPEGALHVIDARAAGRLPAAFVEPVAVELFRNSSLAVRALASAGFQRPGGGASPSIEELVALQGDVRRGRELFQGLGEHAGRAQCATCHAFQLGDTRLGADLGPELTEIRRKLAPDALFDAILNPSAGIALGYETYVVRTTDGLLHSGFLLADGPVLALLTTSGERVAVPAEEVAERRRQPTSTMPEGAALGLTAQDLADLVAFLSADPSAPPAFGEEVVLFDGTDVEAWTFYLNDPAARFEDVWTVRDGVLGCEGHPAGYLRTKAEHTSFALSLEWRFDPARGAGNSGVLLRRIGSDKVWPRSIEAQLQSGNAGDFWNIDAFPMHADPLRTSGRHTARAAPSSESSLGAWNRYDILVDGARVELRVNGVLQNAADWCAEVPGHICLQSEGAYIEFRDVRLRPIVGRARAPR